MHRLLEYLILCLLIGATLSSILLSVPEVELFLRELNTNMYKAYGPDGLPSCVLVECASELAP